MRIPLSIYRLQLNREFNFQSVCDIVEYLSLLGISDIYYSPIFKARTASLHGYDVIDHSQLNPELGGEALLARLLDLTNAKGLGWIQDIVPNHMAYDSQNRMLMDVFENGPLSKYSGYFDIEWAHPYENLKGKALAPFLEEFYGDCLKNKKIVLEFNESGFAVRYKEFVFPVRIGSYLKILSLDLEDLRDRLGSINENYLKFLELTETLKKIEGILESAERTRQIAIVKSSLWNLYYRENAVKDHLSLVLSKFNTPEELDRLLTEQYFRFSFWKVGNEELNYRRFFTVNGLICLNTQKEEVFDYAHSLILRLAGENKISGLRIDHLDGLYNPLAYLKRLREKMPEAYIAVEKILDLYEELPEDFPVQGTTGYDFLNYLNGIFIEKKNENLMKKYYIGFSGMDENFRQLVSDKKRLFIGRYMAGDIDNLAHILRDIFSRYLYARDITIYGLKRALVETMAQFPVYRSYVSSAGGSDNDKANIKEAIVRAKNISPGLIYELNFIEKVLLLDFDSGVSDQERAKWVHFVCRFQQYTGPLMAKGAEDTAFYIYNCLISANEVGGNPSLFGISREDFRDFNIRRAQRWSASFNATSTHDTKRGEDVRARINALSEIPQEWIAAVRLWHKTNKAKKTLVGNFKAPDKNDEYFIYQTLIGAFPFLENEFPAFIRRLKDYIIKAVREAKMHTGWVKPDPAYEEACVNFVTAILEAQHPFLKQFLPFQKKIAHYGIFNSLSQVLLKITLPGVPDFYQGSELWDLNLVDPDNRRPVDFQKRSAILRDIRQRRAQDVSSLIAELSATKEDGRIKLFLIQRLLALRNEIPDLFRKGNYIPLEVKGKLNAHIVAFARKYQDDWVVGIAPLLLANIIKEGQFPLGEKLWKDTRIIMPKEAPAHLSEAITGLKIEDTGPLLIGRILKNFPVSVLTNKKTKLLNSDQ